VVGIAKTRDPNGGFSKELSLITQSFEGPIAVVDTRGRGPDRARDPARLRRGRILIPVTGTEVSRRGVEVGLILARASDAQVTALYVTRANSGASRHNPSRRLVMRRNELAVLKEIAGLAERYDVPLRSTTRADMAPDEAILREAGRGYDLVVLGVSRRPGEVLFFGNTAAAVLERPPNRISSSRVSIGTLVPWAPDCAKIEPKISSPKYRAQVEPKIESRIEPLADPKWFHADSSAARPIRV